MGLYANYYAVTPTELASYLVQDDIQEVFENLEEIAGGEDIKRYTDLDKFWEGLHFLLTGYDSNSKYNAEKTPLNLTLYHAFFGQKLLPASDDVTQIFYIPVENVPQITDMLNNLNFGDFTQNVDFKKFTENEIYPDVWDEDHEDLLKDLEDFFIDLKEFYQNAKNENLAVITCVG